MIDRSNYINNSVGANGSDLEWERIGKLYGFNNHIHFHFQQGLDYRYKILTPQELKLADPYLKKANYVLKRKFPSKNEFVNNLLRRNYYQVINSEAVFAIGITFDGITVNGGTGWAVEMAKLMYKPIYLFDQGKKCWKTWSYDTFKFIDSQIPILTETFAGIGTREITEEGRKNIALVYKETLKHLYNKRDD